ncbi:GNAT family N-acetyltransferase [Yangia sp. PrR004]|nr:GNAT family N-acetyltransferase [Salipiger sp. PrR004]
MIAGIRPATSSDRDCLFGLFRDFFLEDGITTTPEDIRANLGTMLQDPRATIFVAESDGAIVGLSSGSLTFGVEFGCAAELEDLYVTPSHRARGWARKLAMAVLVWAQANGARETYLVITPEAERRQGLTAFYRKLGFVNSHRTTMYRTNFEASE